MLSRFFPPILLLLVYVFYNRVLRNVIRIRTNRFTPGQMPDIGCAVRSIL
jgi:hypothetical protein